MQDWKMTEEVEEVEIAELVNDGQHIAGVKFPITKPGQRTRVSGLDFGRLQTQVSVGVLQLLRMEDKQRCRLYGVSSEKTA